MPCFRNRLVVYVSIAALAMFLPDVSRPQAPQPDGGGLRRGTLPKVWRSAGPNCLGIPEFQVHEYNRDFYILHQSGCSHFEKPFLYLLFGRDKVLLLDTGAGRTNVAQVVKRIISQWLVRNRRTSVSIQLVVAHTHSHGDHIAGDNQFAGLANTAVIAPNLGAVQSFFGITSWPEQIVQYDLGGRTLDVIPIPGHEAASIAIYDRQTGILFTGDTLYPGRLYVANHTQFVLSIRRLVEFTQDKPVAHILGAHIENTRTPYLDYPVGTAYQPNEHELELGRGELLELHDALQRMRGTITRMAMRDFTIWPN